MAVGIKERGTVCREETEVQTRTRISGAPDRTENVLQQRHSLPILIRVRALFIRLAVAAGVLSRYRVCVRPWCCFLLGGIESRELAAACQELWQK